MSKIIIKKLPSFYMRELNRKINCSYPTISQLLENSSELIKLLRLGRNAAKNTKSSLADQGNSNSVAKSKISPFERSASRPVKGTSVFIPKGCRLCSGEHSTSKWVQ